ncbi:LIM-domain binding protein-domain-containing protein [Zopfochytrium polystomum]|nr:LIM-domain binding protein-domain-containing protein [Zopfochytrium polystomum]
MSPNLELMTSPRYWREFVSEFFSETGQIVHHLYDHSSKSERIFPICYELIPRFFITLYTSVITKTEVVISRAREAEFGDENQYLSIECPRTSVIYHYSSGVKIIHRGQFKVVFNAGLKVESLLLMWNSHFEELIPRALCPRAMKRDDSGGSSPISGDEPKFPELNEFGVPVTLMRCFEIMESLHSMREMISEGIPRNFGIPGRSEVEVPPYSRIGSQDSGEADHSHEVPQQPPHENGFDHSYCDGTGAASAEMFDSEVVKQSSPSPPSATSIISPDLLQCQPVPADGRTSPTTSPQSVPQKSPIPAKGRKRGSGTAEVDPRRRRRPAPRPGVPGDAPASSSLGIKPTTKPRAPRKRPSIKEDK